MLLSFLFLTGIVLTQLYVIGRCAASRHVTARDSRVKVTFWFHTFCVVNNYYFRRYNLLIVFFFSIVYIYFTIRINCSTFEYVFC